ncbi:aquaporin-11 [Hoplias malabaricus]|uniref:aquaporin-11 n=1 Tax=Hoplias malabaricus TaxID=27720 RepID=UPI0034617F7D
MSDLWVSLLVLVSIVLVCELVRRASARLLSDGGYGVYVAEFVSTLQLCACTHELKLLGDAGVSTQPQLLALALTYVTSVVQALTSRGATCNPSGALERFLRRSDGALTGARLAAVMLARVASQFAAAVAARLVLRRVWARGLSELHARHWASAFQCASPIVRAPLLEAAAVETICAFAVHASSSCTRTLQAKHRVHALAAVITTVSFAGGSTTGAVFNPAVAFSTQFPCSGGTFAEYSLVYWMGPLLGVAFSILLFDKVIFALSVKSTSLEELKYDTIDRKKRKKKK